MNLKKIPWQHYPFKSNFLNINGLYYHYLDEGMGEPVLMIHGNPTWSFYFRLLVKSLSTNYRVIVPDHIGCGLSQQPDDQQYGFRLQDRVWDLTVLMRHLKLQHKVTLILHDWGGMIGLAWALDHISQIGRIIVMNTAGFFPPNGKTIPWRLKMIHSGGKLIEQAVLKFNLFARAAIYMAPRKPLPHHTIAGLLAPYDTPHNRLATLKFVLDIPLRKTDPSGEIVARVDENLHQICQCAVLILWGAHDFVFDHDYYKIWCQRLPHAEAHFFKNAGHYLVEDIPNRLIFLIKQFLHNYPLGC